MQGTHFTISHHVSGTLAANLSFVFTMPFDAQLVNVSVVGSNANNGIIDIGNSGDADAYLDGKDIGDSATPIVYDDPSDFVDSKFPHIVAGTVVIAALDYDGGAGTATHDYTLLMTFTEG